MKRVIHWFRRDLRLTDNTALAAAARQAELVIPVFILEDAFRTGPDVGAARLAFLLRALAALHDELAELGYPLIIRGGQSEEILPQLCAETKAEAVFCNRRYEPYAQARDSRVFNQLNAAGVGFEVFKDAVLWEEREILTKAGSPFTVFSPYAKVWRTRPRPTPHPALRPAKQPFPRIASERLPLDPAELGHPLRQTIPPAGQGAARAALDHFLAGPIFDYGTQRDIPSVKGTSQLSAHLRCGTIGIRTVLAQVAKAETSAPISGRESCQTFLNELIWREFYLQILANFPQVMRGSFRPDYDQLEWSEDEAHFQAWCLGQTGYPIVDAAMRCLNATGWMHNRLRMVTAMFFTKDLLLNWQRGERYFMQQLVDGDMAANNGGWQWSAGTGTDAAPYFRIFNPLSQAQRFDPDGSFVRAWVPELADAPDKLIHQPWKDPRFARQAGYAAPIVEHSLQRTKWLAMYKAVLRRSKPAPVE